MAIMDTLIESEQTVKSHIYRNKGGKRSSVKAQLYKNRFLGKFSDMLDLIRDNGEFEMKD